MSLSSQSISQLEGLIQRLIELPPYGDLSAIAARRQRLLALGQQLESLGQQLEGLEEQMAALNARARELARTQTRARELMSRAEQLVEEGQLGRARDMLGRARELALGAARRREQLQKEARVLAAKIARARAAAGGAARAREQARRLLRKMALAAGVGRMVAHALGRVEAGAGDGSRRVEEALTLAEELRQGQQRLERLEALVEAMGKRLAGRKALASALLREARSFNRRVEALERRLEELSAELVAEPARAGALSVLEAEAQALVEQGAGLSERISVLAAAFRNDYERARRLLNAWRQQAKTLRVQAQRAWAMARQMRRLAEEVAEARARVFADGRQILGLVRPVAKRGLAHERVLEAIRSWARRLRDLAQLSAGAERAAQALERAQQQLRLPGHKAPIRLKDFSPSLQRISARTLHVERAQAVGKAAAYWREMVAGPMGRALRRPVEDVALAVADMLGRAGARAEQAQEQIAALRAELSRLSRELSRKDKALAWQRATMVHLREQAKRTHRRAGYWRARAAEARAYSEELSRKLGRTQHKASALKAKMLERHKALKEARAQLNQQHKLIEQLEAHLAQTRAEARRWSELASTMAQALVAMGQAHSSERQRALEELARLKVYATALEQELGRMALVSGLVRSRRVSLEQLRTLARRVVAARARLLELGRRSMGQVLMVVLTTAGLLLASPHTATKATLSPAPLIPSPPPLEQQVIDGPLAGETYLVPALGRRLGPKVEQARVRARFFPGPSKATAGLKARINALARSCGVEPKVLLATAARVFAHQRVVSLEALELMARRVQVVKARYPRLFQEFAEDGLPPAAMDLATLPPEPEPGLYLLTTRLYRDYRALGMSPEDALRAVVRNERAAAAVRRQWRVGQLFTGRVRPIPQLEKMGLRQFLQRMSPYIAERCRIFLRSRGIDYHGDINAYAQNLALDMYCAAKRFGVPVSFLMAIAHQETWYANVLGDQRRSASPFQIFHTTKGLIIRDMRRAGFSPPPRSIRLEKHLTTATYMAAFHLRQLMALATYRDQATGLMVVDTDRVMKMYNGASTYARRVAARQSELRRFLGL